MKDIEQEVLVEGRNVCSINQYISVESGSARAVRQEDPIRSRLDRGTRQIHGAFHDVADHYLFNDLRAELLDLQSRQRSREQDGSTPLTVVRMDDTTDKVWLDYMAMPAHTSVLCKLESALDAQAFAWGSNLYEDNSVPFDFHRDGDTYSTGTANELLADLSIVASFGGPRNFTFIHCTTGREFSFLQRDGDVVAFNRDVDNEFMHGLRPAEDVHENTERISVVIFGRSLISNRRPAIERLPIPRIVSMSCPRFTETGSPRLLQFTGVFVSPEQVKTDPKDLPVGRQRNSILSRSSLEDANELCQQLGGRLESIETTSEILGSVRCAVFEPSSKTSGKQMLVSIGVAICLQGLPLSTAGLKEWFAAAQKVGWLDAGITVMIPNLQMSSAFEKSDYEAVVVALLASRQFQACLLVGKDEGACLCISIAVECAVSAKVVGVIMAGPSSPPPLASCDLRVPALLLWAIDDEVSHYDERHEWIRALDGRRSSTSFKESIGGGHRLDRILEYGKELASAVYHFTVTTFFVHELEGNNCGQVDSLARLDRLSTELPHIFQQSILDYGLGNKKGEERSDMGTGSTNLAICLGTSARRRLSKTLQCWIQADMVIASASE